MRENQSEEAIIQNLKDAGCDSDTIEKFMAESATREKIKRSETVSCPQKKTA